MKFSAWAPLAKSVSLVLKDGREALQENSDGEWSVDIDAARAAGGYRYSLDDGPPLPDPRSRWQPDGVHGDSHVVDAAELQAIHRSAFVPRPLRDAVIYELHVGTFTPEGTYAAAQSRIRHLVALGVTHVELLPLATFPGDHGWGYDGVDLYAPLPAYGTPQDLARFVRACHDQGLAVLLDVVYNHLGPDGNYLGAYGPFFTDRVKTPWGEAVNYDGAYSDGVRRFVIDNALMWLGDYGFDGLRLDAVHAIYSFEAVHVLEELASAVEALGTASGREFVLIAESDLNDPRLVHPVERGGYGLQAHWEDDFHHAVHRLFTGEDNGYYADYNGIEDLAVALRDAYVYQDRYSRHRQRRHGRAPEGVTPDQIVICAQNHDQIGNRATGERLSMLVSAPQLKAIAALTLLSPFVPMLFQGEEWGARTPFLYFTDHQDAKLGRLVAEGRAKEFSAFAWAGEVPNPQEADTFQRSKLDWSELAVPEQAELLDWHRHLIALRAADPAGPLTAKPEIAYDAKANWLTYRYANRLVVLNLGSQAVHVPMPAGAWALVLHSHAEDSAAAPEVPAQGTRVFKPG